MYSLWIVQWDFTRRDHPGNLGRVSASGLVTKCIFLGFSQLQKGVVIPPRLIDALSLLMSPSSRTHLSSPPPNLFLLLKSYPFPSSPCLYLMMYLLIHFRFIIVVTVTVPLFLSLLLRSLPTHFLSLQLLLPRLCLLLITCSLLFGKVIALLAILILFTIF